MNWKKMSWRTIGIIAGAFFVFCWLIKAPIASWYLSKSMKVPVHMTTLTVWPSQMTIHNFQIKNPKGFNSRNALEVKKAEADYHLKDVRANPSVIDLIRLDDVKLTVEFSNPLGTQSNWTAISNGMTPSKKEEKKSDSKGVLIHKLTVYNLTVETKGIGVQNQVKHFDYIEMNDVGSNSGFPTQLVMRKLFDQADLNKYLPKDFELPQDTIQNFFRK